MFVIENKSWRLKIFLLIFLIMLLLPSCKKKETKVQTEKAINVKVHSVEAKLLMPFIETIGSLSPYEEVAVSAEIDGIMKEVSVDNGSEVLKGMLLATIDDTDYSLEVKRAEAALRQAQASFENTRLEFSRKESLFREQLITRQQFDDVKTRLTLTEADLERANASLLLAKQRLKKTRIYSPISGFIKEKKVSAGDYVKNGTTLFVIIQNKPLKLNFSVSEREIGKLKRGQEVIFKVDSFSDKDFKGRVSTIYPSLDEKTRTLQVEALVPNTEGLLKPGLFAHVTLYTGVERNIVLVPIISLLYEGETIKVFVVENGITKERFVKVGQKYGEEMEIVEGVKEGEIVVTAGQQNLFDGVKVNVAR